MGEFSKKKSPIYSIKPINPNFTGNQFQMNMSSIFKIIFFTFLSAIIFNGCTPAIKKTNSETAPARPVVIPVKVQKPERPPEIIELPKDDKIIRVGLMENYKKVVFRWNGSCSISGSGGTVVTTKKKSSSSWEAAVAGRSLVLTDDKDSEKLVFDEKITVKADNEDSYIEIAGVKEGKGWHWEKSKTRRYRGSIEFVLVDGAITVVNELPLNQYLYGVVPSEMPHQAPFEALKAQAVLARTNTYSTLGDKYKNKPYQLFSDVFSQVYGGMINERESSNKAVDATSGIILTYNDKPVEATFHSVCGGYMESFDWIWSGKPVGYSVPHADNADDNASDLSSESAFKDFIDNPPESFCNMNLRKFPAAFDYAKKYFRWQKVYSRAELERVINKNMSKVIGKKVKIGSLKSLAVTSRGKSGKIRTMKVIGTAGSFEVNKELNVRRLLADSPLYSANFYVETKGPSSLPTDFVIKGAGFGHSGGMCQVGAVGMAIDGYKYQDILEFYFPGSKATRLPSGNSNN